MALSIINTLANLHAANMSLNSDGNIIQQAYDKVSTLEEIQKRRSEEAVFSEEDLTKEDTNPEPDEESEVEEETEQQLLC